MRVLVVTPAAGRSRPGAPSAAATVVRRLLDGRHDVVLAPAGGIARLVRLRTLVRRREPDVVVLGPAGRIAAALVARAAGARPLVVVGADREALAAHAGRGPGGARTVLVDDAAPRDVAAAQLTGVLAEALRPRVVVLHNVVAPYRLAMFESLASSVDLTVIFTQEAGRGRFWSTSLDGSRIRHEVLPAVHIGPVVYNPTGFRRLRRSRFDVLVTNTDPDTAPLSLLGLLLVRLRRGRLVVWSEVTDAVVRSFLPLVPVPGHDRGRPATLLASWVDAAVLAYRRLFLDRAERVLAFSRAAEDFLLRTGIPEHRIVRTHQVVPRELLPPPRCAPQRDGRTFLYLGYLNVRKNVALLIDAFAGLPDGDARLLIAGAGPAETSLRRRAAADPRIRFCGYVEGQAKAELLAGADVLVLPTLHDCWGLVVNEAIHYGLAVIVSDRAAARELVDETRGIVVPSGDLTALTEAMARLLREPHVLRALQRRNLGSAHVSDLARAVEPVRAALLEVTS